MGEVVNLNKFRKQKAKDEKAAQAESNRVKHGTKKADKTLSKARKDKADKDLDGKKREDD